MHRGCAHMDIKGYQSVSKFHKVYRGLMKALEGRPWDIESGRGLLSGY
jgi:hypothetical protein